MKEMRLVANEDFLAFVGPAAMEIERLRGYPAEALLTQVHLESAGLGKYPKGSNNVLGVKFDGEGEYVEADTWEQIDGKWIVVTAKFQKYASIVDCLTGWADLMDKSWYAQAQPFRHSWPAFLALIWHNGEETVYATDDLYLWKAVKRAAEVGIPEWCAAERERMNVVRFILDGEEQEYGRLVDGSPHVRVRPLLDLIGDVGGGWNYSYENRTLTVTSPPRKPWWRRW